MENSVLSLEKAFAELSETIPELLATHISDSMEGTTPLPTNKKRISSEIRTELSSFKTKCQKGLQHILQEVPQENAKRIQASLEKAFHSLLTASIFTTVVLKVIAGHSWRESLKISQEDIEHLYEGARTIFEKGCFEEAIDSFTFLSWLDAKQYECWMALGHSYFHMANHSKASKVYNIASHCFPEEPWPYVYSSLCFEALGNREEAKESLSQAIKKANTPELVSSLTRRLQLLASEPISPIS